MKVIKKAAKWTGIVLGCLVVLVLLAYTTIYFNTEKRFNTVYQFETEVLSITNDSASIVQGEHLFKIKGCSDCHGANLAGKVFIDDPALGRLIATNLTKGRGGLPADYSTTDWLRALRHGINREGKPLLFMPSHESAKMTTQDLSAVIAYCQGQPPVDNELPTNEIKPLARVLLVFDKLTLLPVEKIDHTAKPVEKLDPMVNATYGEYLAVTCVGCHHADFKGGEPPAPDFPQVPNITGTGNVGNWSEDQFIHTLRTGQTPEGKQLRNEFMPWKMTSQYTDTELKALRSYLVSIGSVTAQN